MTMKVFVGFLVQPNSILLYPLRYFMMNMFYVIGVFFVLNEIVRRTALLTVFETERLLVWAIVFSLLESISTYYKMKKSQGDTSTSIVS